MHFYLSLIEGLVGDVENLVQDLVDVGVGSGRGTGPSGSILTGGGAVAAAVGGVGWRTGLIRGRLLALQPGVTGGQGRVSPAAQGMHHGGLGDAA